MSEKKTNTYREAYASACRRMKEAGVCDDDLENDAMRLLTYCIRKSWLWLTMHDDEPLDPAAAARYGELIDRRIDNEPMAYLTGRVYFYENNFSITPGVLIPRIDTEVLVDQTLARIDKRRKYQILELGCGSGAVVASVVMLRHYIKGLAVDIDPAAVALARENLAYYELDKRIQVLQGDWFEPVGKQRKFNFIISNPPYISKAEMAGLPESVKKEPEQALWGGEDGLDCYRKILPDAYRALEDNGWCLVEIGWKQGSAVRAMFRSVGFMNIDIYKDDGLRNRVVAGQKNGVQRMERRIRYWKVKRGLPQLRLFGK